MNADEAQRVVTKAREKKLFCMEAMWMRFIPLVQQAKQLLSEIGDVQMLTADFALPSANDMDGAVLDRGVYCLNLAQYLLGPPTRAPKTGSKKIPSFKKSSVACNR